jgi:hypothetical protein
MLSHILTPRFSAMILSIAFLTLTDAPILAQYEFTSFSAVDSIVPGEAGRSRIITATEARNHQDYVSINGKDGRNKSSRKNIRIETFEGIKLLTSSHSIDCARIHGTLLKMLYRSKIDPCSSASVIHCSVATFAS